MRTRIGSLATVPALLALAGVAVSLVLAEEIPLPKFYKSLADKNHYPAAESLTSAQADVKCNIFDTVVAAFPDAAGKPIAVKFFWSRPDPNGAPKMKFAVTGIPDTLTDLTNRSNLIFQPVTEFVIPSPIYWTFEQTTVKAISEGGKIAVTGEPKSAQSPIKKLTADVDAASYQVSKMQLDLGQAQVSFEMTYKDLGGKWGIEKETIALPQGKRVIKFEYAQVENYWMPSKMSVDNIGPDGKQPDPTYVFDFSNWQVNKGLPEGTF